LQEAEFLTSGNMKFDLIVVGAGPAGSMAARTAANAGLKVALLEKRQEIGKPIRCAGGISKSSLDKLVKPDPKWIAAEVKAARIYAPDGTRIMMSGNQAQDEAGYILDRSIFDRALATDAARSGAEVFVKTRAVGLLKMEDDMPCGIYAQKEGELLKIEAPLVIGADGVESKVGRWAGIDTVLKLKDIEVCAQFLVQDRSIDEDYCEFYLGNEIAPGGYVWSFPKGDRMANVGVCIQGSNSYPGLAAKLLEDFIRKRMPDARLLDLVVGAVPASGPIENTISDGVMLVGDAARQSDPLTYGGILNGMKAGMMAGEIAANVTPEGDFRRTVFKAYEERWRSNFGKEIRRNYKLKSFISKLTDQDLNSLLHVLESQDTSRMDLEGLVKQLFRLNPGLLWKMRSVLF
jgi:digeranylgeranylglycerophospholipid reductase